MTFQVAITHIFYQSIHTSSTDCFNIKYSNSTQTIKFLISAISNNPRMHQQKLDTFRYQQTLKYQIVDQNNFAGNGNIQDIKKATLNKSWKMYSAQQQFCELTLKMMSPSIIRKVKVKFIDVHHSEITLRGHNKKVISKTETIGIKKNSQIVIQPQDFDPVSSVSIKLTNNSHSHETMGITYILFEGDCDELPKKPKSKSKIGADEYQPNNFKSRRDQSVRMFQKRTRPSSRTSKQNITDFREYEQSKRRQIPSRKKKHLNNHKEQQSYEMKMAVALSKSEAQKRQNGYQKSYEEIDSEFQEFKNKRNRRNSEVMEVQNPEPHRGKITEGSEENWDPAIIEEHQVAWKHHMYQNGMQVQVESNPTYHTVAFSEELIEPFQNVNIKWLNAQKKAEEHMGVRSDQRLSSFVKIKHLIGVSVYVHLEPEWKSEQVVEQARNLGANIIFSQKEIKDGTLVIVSKKDAISMAKKSHLKDKKQIKYLNHKYVEQCRQIDAKLNEKDYYHKL